MTLRKTVLISVALILARSGEAQWDETLARQVAESLGRVIAGTPATEGGSAQVGGCVGDCNGNGLITVDELIRAVNIALGTATIDECDAFGALGEGAGGGVTVTVAKLIAAVNSALCGCGAVCPTPQPTSTRTATPFPTVTQASTSTMPPTGTPTRTGPVNVAGRWFSRDARLAGSNCDPLLNDLILELLGLQAPCTFDVTANGTRLSIVNCNGVRYQGTVDATGVIAADYSFSQSQSGCRVSSMIRLAVEASRSPTQATFTVPLNFSSGCGIPDCAMELQSVWSR